jgi:hypothetical protein
MSPIVANSPGKQPMKPTCFEKNSPSSLAVENGACGLVKRVTGLSLGLGLAIGLLMGSAPGGMAAGVQIMGQLANFDVRYPQSLPNDLEIVLYGAGLTTNAVAGTWFNSQWGAPVSITASINTDTNSPGYGLDCVVIRYAGPPHPELVGQLMHFGVRLRLGAAVAHQEVWWTINGQRILRPCDPHITWICTPTGWLVCVANPTTQPMYVYGARFFPVGTGAPLPLLSQMTTLMQPQPFGAADWTPLPLPGGQRVFCIPAWCRIYFRVQVVRWRPIILQIAARNVPEAVLPLPTGTEGPNPNDWNGENGTMVILTTRPTQEMSEDLNGDGVVGIPDFNQLRAVFGAQSEDAGQTQ